MSEVSQDKEREDRISNKIVVDAYDPEEQAMGWYYYLERVLKFPFPAMSRDDGQAGQVIGMAPEEECYQEMMVDFEFDGDAFVTPLSQLEAPEADLQTQQAIADWHYWVDQGYEF